MKKFIGKEISTHTGNVLIGEIYDTISIVGLIPSNRTMLFQVSLGS